jgi:hypothetical protein
MRKMSPVSQKVLRIDGLVILRVAFYDISKPRGECFGVRSRKLSNVGQSLDG